ncbi:hypothetical protein CDAR_286901 [Caerostris darwini]|uniref:Uncharacterized protein n=1 Tax=Caerostris darwini TaxID=1538125 RepID=A0AAV4RCA3_9ARAC|nr:hypothetical protein CDAR_286901 [Caerostris darwini]
MTLRILGLRMRKAGVDTEQTILNSKTPPLQRAVANQLLMSDLLSWPIFSHSKPEWPGRCIVNAGSECSAGSLPVGVKFEPRLIVRG